jgi:hypothetical protein
MSKIFVIAGTYHEAQEWIRKNYQERAAIGDQQASVRDYLYVSKAEDLKGIQDPHGVFVGNWLGRPDIFHIVEELMLRSTHVNKALGKIYGDLKPKVRPTPKLKPVSGGWINEELVKQFNGGDMTNRYKEVRKAMDTL